MEDRRALVQAAVVRTLLRREVTTAAWPMSNDATPPSTSVSVPASRPPRSGPGPPAGARTYYKVVAVTSAEEFVSIFDGRTRYKLDEVTTPRGGCGGAEPTGGRMAEVG